jgi:hypothetical protein
VSSRRERFTVADKPHRMQVHFMDATPSSVGSSTEHSGSEQAGSNGAESSRTGPGFPRGA